jgi:hypothetical protein
VARRLALRTSRLIDLSDVETEHVVVHPIVAGLYGVGKQVKDLRKLQNLTVINGHVSIDKHKDPIGLNRHARLHVACHDLV